MFFKYNINKLSKMDLRKERRKERRYKKKNGRKKKHLKNQDSIHFTINDRISISYNWCLDEECIESCDFFNTEEELKLHMESEHN
jgi:hypothetical protein